MLSSRTLIPVAVLAAAPLAIPLAAGAASVPSIAVWQGKTKQHKLGMFLDQVTSGKAVQISVNVPCKDASGMMQSVRLAASKLPKGGHVKLDKKKATPTGGDAHPVRVNRAQPALDRHALLQARRERGRVHRQGHLLLEVHGEPRRLTGTRRRRAT